MLRLLLRRCMFQELSIGQSRAAFRKAPFFLEIATAQENSNRKNIRVLSAIDV